jgi:hypothetical protein
MITVRNVFLTFFFYFTQVLATSCSSGSAGLPVAKLLLDASLTAGKAARDVTKVPAIASLQQYGSGASRYSSEPPAALTQAAAEVSLLKE